MAMGSSRVARTAASLAIAVVLVAASSACGTGADPRVVLYGDSLGVEASDELAAHLAGTATFESASVGGFALCDSLERMREDIHDSDPPRFVLIQFSGNNLTKCMQQANGRPLEGDELAAKYANDARVAVRMLRSAGIEVYLIGSPIAALTYGANAVNAEFGRIAEEWRDDGGVHYIDAGSAVSPDQTYTRTLPCLTFETEDLGCRNGRIPVRAPDGNHFCPPGTDATIATECPVWSSGAYRFATAMADPLLDRLSTSVPDVRRR